MTRVLRPGWATMAGLTWLARVGPAPLDAWHQRRTSDSTVAEIDKLLDDHTCAEIAGILNSQGLQTGTGMPFTAAVVDQLRITVGRDIRPTAAS